MKKLKNALQRNRRKVALALMATTGLMAQSTFADGLVNVADDGAVTYNAEFMVKALKAAGMSGINSGVSIALLVMAAFFIFFMVKRFGFKG